MDKVTRYREILKKVLQEFVAARNEGNGDITTQLIMDSERDHYQILRQGWRNGQQFFNVIFHFDIINGKIWLQRNISDYDIIADIKAAGIPKDAIVLAFYSPSMRPDTGYAVS